jgi:hypothetical protein
LQTAKQKPERSHKAPAILSVSTADALERRIDVVEQKVTKKGFPSLSQFWRDTFQRFVRSGRRQLVIRAGRRAGKSSSLCRFAVAYALWFATLGRIPPGDIGWVVFVSLSREEAGQRLYTIKTLLSALGITHEESGDTIRLTAYNIGFRVLTCSIAGVSGWTSILIVADEVAKWMTKETGANPAKEVLAALRPTGATTKAPVILSSSPVTDDDEHARAFDRGETDFQTTAFAPTWVANPTVSEAETHNLEDAEDERVWRREYAAIPQPGVLDGYLADVIQPCVDKTRTAAHPKNPRAQYIIALDPAWRRDEFAVAVLRADVTEDFLPRVVVEEVYGWRPKPGEVLSVENTCERIAQLCERYSTHLVYSDQKDVDTLQAMLLQKAVSLIGVPWTAQNKTGKFRLFRSLCMDRRVELPNDPALIKQLESICIKLTPSGTETFEGRGSDDRAFAVVLGAAEAVALAPGESQGISAGDVRRCRWGGSARGY